MGPLEHLALLADLLDDLQVDWVLGGSLASSLRGEPRSTYDVDVAVDMDPSRVPDFVQAAQESYYAPKGAFLEAATQKSSFNLLHTRSGFKVDIFFLGGEALDRLQMQRREWVVLDHLERGIWVTSAPDIILRKLWWFRLGGEASDRQWRDVRGVLKLQRRHLDLEALASDAVQAGVGDLLDRLIRETDADE